MLKRSVLFSFIIFILYASSLVARAEDPGCRLTSAAYNNNLTAASRLIESGVPAGGSCNGVPALNLAAQQGHPEMVSLLIEKGAKVDSRDPNGVTPLGQATQGRHISVMKLLLTKGADPNITDKRGKRHLMIAAEGGDMEVLKILLGGGADVNAKDGEGNTAVMTALIAKHPRYIDVIRLFLERGADPNSVNRRGATPLMIAAAIGQLDAVTLLVDKGANIDARMNTGETALDWARKSGKSDVARFLRDKKANRTVSKYAQEKTAAVAPLSPEARLPDKAKNTDTSDLRSRSSRTSDSIIAPGDENIGAVYVKMTYKATGNKPMMIKSDGSVSMPPGTVAEVKLFAKYGKSIIETTHIGKLKEKRGSADIFETEDKVAFAALPGRIVTPVVSRSRAAECAHQPAKETAGGQLFRLWSKQNTAQLRSLAAATAPTDPGKIKATCTRMESTPNVAAEEVLVAFSKSKDRVTAQTARKSLATWRTRWGKILNTRR